MLVLYFIIKMNTFMLLANPTTMKTKLILLLLSFTSGLGYGQTIKEKEVPSVVIQTFRNEFPDVKVEKWEKEGANYEVEFNVMKIETSIAYDANGNWLEREVEIKPSELPEFILNYLEKNLSGKKIKEACKISSSDGRITYELEVEDTEYTFQDPVGLIKQEKQTNKKEDKD